MQPSSPEPTAQRFVWPAVGAAAGLAVAVGMFLISSEPPARSAVSRPIVDTFTVSGSVVLGDAGSFTWDGQGGCAGAGPYADMADGAAVIIMAGGGFAGGRLTDPRAPGDGTCRFSFTVAGVPTGQDAYLVMVGERDPRQYTADGLADAVASLRVD